MKKTIFSTIGLIAAMASFAQFKVGVQAIGNLSSATIQSVPDVNFTKTMRVVPGAGVVAQYEISDKLSLQTGFNYLQHGVIVESKLDQTMNIQAGAENTLHFYKYL